jgi:anti-sigma factor RsiW
MHCAEYQDLVAAHVDALLTAEETTLAVAHLAGCARCTRIFETSQHFRAQTRALNWTRPTPGTLRQQLVAALDAADAPERPRWWRTWWPRPVFRLAMAGALAVVALVIATSVMRGPRSPAAPPVLAAVVADFRAVEADKIVLGYRTDDPQELRDYFQRTGAMLFSNTVMDLEVLGYQLVGGTVVELDGKKSTLTVYRGPHGLLVCHRFQGADLPLPPGGETIRGDTFYTINGITICLHREGDMVCLMASALPRDVFIKRWTGSA